VRRSPVQRGWRAAGRRRSGGGWRRGPPGVPRSRARVPRHGNMVLSRAGRGAVTGPLRRRQGSQVAEGGAGAHVRAARGTQALRVMRQQVGAAPGTGWACRLGRRRGWLGALRRGLRHQPDLLRRAPQPAAAAPQYGLALRASAKRLRKGGRHAGHLTGRAVGHLPGLPYPLRPSPPVGPPPPRLPLRAAGCLRGSCLRAQAARAARPPQVLARARAPRWPLPAPRTPAPGTWERGSGP
jgi:hypothetical protein